VAAAQGPRGWQGSPSHPASAANLAAAAAVTAAAAAAAAAATHCRVISKLDPECKLIALHASLYSKRKYTYSCIQCSHGTQFLQRTCKQQQQNTYKAVQSLLCDAQLD
jgi:hypothetical protein